MSDALGIILASAAFGVALLILYRTSVRRADIDLLLYELDTEPLTGAAAILQSLMSVGSSQERLEFLG